jgi:polysaccharide biosynthesis transport protein
MSYENQQAAGNGTDIVSAADRSTSNVFTSIVRFLYIVQLRKGVLIASLLIAAVGGGIYYSVAPRYYDASTQIYIIRAEGASVEQGVQATGVAPKLPTHVRLIQSQVVLREALRNLPADFRVDLKGLPEQLWPSQLRKNLNVNYERLTSLIDIRYRSLDPLAAKEVVSAIQAAYLKFVNVTTSEGANEDLEKLMASRDSYEQQLNLKMSELAALQNQLGEIQGGDGTSVNVERMKLLDLAQQLREHEKKTIEARAYKKAVDDAIANGQDLVQFMIQSMDSIGRTLLEQEFGINKDDALLLARMTEQVITDESRYQSLSQIYGPNNPTLQSLKNKILTTRQFLSNYEFQRQQNLQQVKASQLATRLAHTSHQRLVQAQELEDQYRNSLNAATLDYERFASARARIFELQTSIKRLDRSHQSVDTAISHFETGISNEIQTEVTSHPMVPAGPATPKLILVVAASGFLGVFLGISAIYVLDMLDDRFRSPEEIQLQINAPVLAMVRQMEPTGGSGIDALHTLTRPNGVETEAFRTLRTALSFSGASTQRIMVTSSEPGDGKTTVMANLAVA